MSYPKDLSVIRRDLLACFDAGVHAVQGRQSVATALSDGLEGDWHLIAIGKAAASMVEGALDALGGQILSGIVISKTGHFDGVEFDDRFQCLEAEHPVPGDGTLVAGAALLKFCDQLPDSAQVLCCVSGGASSLVEALPEGMGLEQLQALNTYLLSTGLDIISMNRIRQSLSKIKAGRLADILTGHQVKALYISDVPGDDICSIGSGPLAPPEEVKEVVYPNELQVLLGDVKPVPPATKSNDSDDHHIVASLDIAKQAAATKGAVLGYEVFVHPEFLEGEAGESAKAVVARLSTAKPGIHIWGGETVVILPNSPGRGGRNQHFALSAAQCLPDDDLYALLAAGTDGSDGPTGDAGGLVDQGTLTRGSAEGLQAGQYLVAADAGSYLEATGDLVNTGPTGTNVMDLVIAFKG